MPQPPLLPEETLHRVLRIARFDGLSVLVVAGFFALVNAAAGDAFGAVTAALAAGAGAVELHGRTLLQHGERRGMNWLLSSQLFLLFVILAYCALKIQHGDVPPVPEGMGPFIEQSARQLGMSTEAYTRFVAQLSLQIFAVVSVFYQGGMALYYGLRRTTVARALSLLASD